MGAVDGSAHERLSRRHRALIVAAILTSVGLAAVILTAARPARPDGAGTLLPRPTEAEARAVLSATYERARQETDPHRFCEPSEYPLSCLNHFYQGGGSARVPTEPPSVIGARTTDTAVVLTVCGTDGSGQPYRSDFPVVRSNGTLRPLLDVFWTGATYSGRKSDGAPVDATPREPQPGGCPTS